jgi:hypothetical protein
VCRVRSRDILNDRPQPGHSQINEVASSIYGIERSIGKNKIKTYNLSKLNTHFFD